MQRRLSCAAPDAYPKDMLDQNTPRRTALTRSQHAASEHELAIGPRDIRKAATLSMLLAAVSSVCLAGALNGVGISNRVPGLPKLALVRTLCVPPTSTRALSEWNYLSGCLLCTSAISRPAR
jgi:hypothetical protein